MTTSPTLTTNEIVNCHRTVCPVTPWLVISGDLPTGHEQALEKLDEWIASGVTDIVDVRGEWSDADLVSAHAPHLRYHYFGTHDDGTSQDAKWFAKGIDALHEAQSHDDAVVMVHCHMGINRGPSMAFALLLDQGWGVSEALDAIRAARPIAGIIYAHDAVRSAGRMKGLSKATIASQLCEVDEWQFRNHIDIRTIIRGIRQAS